MNLSFKLLQGYSAVDNALNTPEVAALLATRGYDASRIKAGRLLIEHAEALHELQERMYSEQFRATEALALVREKMTTLYRTHVKLARVVFRKRPSALKELGLIGDREQALDGLIRETSLFYNVALSRPDLMAELATVGVSQTELEQGRLLLQDLMQAYAVQQQAMARAQDATAKRNEAVEAMDDWIAGFVKVSRVSLESRPQLMEMLGVLVPS